MGTTAATLHVLVPPQTATGKVVSDFKRAYKQLGFDFTEQAVDPPRSVVFKGGRPGEYVSVYDSENDRLDSGLLKDLAVAVSKGLGTVAIVSGLYDSDAYSFIVYYKGKQVDAAVGGDLWTGDGLQMLTGKKRARKWREIFAARDAARGSYLGPEDWLRRTEAVAPQESPFADDDLAQWCRAAGLDPIRTTAITEDFSGPDGPDKSSYFLRTVDREPKPSERGSSVQQLSFVRSDDDYPDLMFYPAPSPARAEHECSPQWGAVTAGQGFHGLRLRLQCDGAGKVRLVSATVVAWPFFNGQITSLKMVASYRWLGLNQSIAGATSVVEEAPDFDVPATKAESRNQFLIMLATKLVLSDGSEATLQPVLESMHGEFAPLTLPRVKLRGLEPNWIPANGPSPDDVVLRLNQPSVATMAAILPMARASERVRAKELFEAWLASLVLSEEITATVRTHKHTMLKGSATKAAWSVPATGLLNDARWFSLFSAERDYQSATIELALPSGQYPIAGAVMATALRRALDVPAERQSHEHLACAVWFLNAPSVYERLGTSAELQTRVFSTWLAEGDALQAWLAEAAWFPTVWNARARTLYEQSIANITHPWYRGLQVRELVARTSDWSARRVRFVGRMVWLSAPLLRMLDAREVERVCDVRTVGRLTELTLKDGFTLNDMEAALAPALPTVDDLIATLRSDLDERSKQAPAYEEFGIALTSLAEHEKGTQRLEEAVEALRRACLQFQRDVVPRGWSSAHKYLGIALMRLGERTGERETLEAAVAAQREAAEVLVEVFGLTKAGHKDEWIATRVQLGIALTVLGEHEGGTGSLNEAVAVFDDILERHPPEGEGGARNAAAISLRAGIALMIVAERHNDVRLAKAALERIEGAMQILRSTTPAPELLHYEAQTVGPRAVFSRLETR